jgi:hypothetical protein
MLESTLLLCRNVLLPRLISAREHQRVDGIYSACSGAFGVAHRPRANWKDFLRLSQVTCPVALYPATTESEKIRFNQINKKTGHRIKYLKVDAHTGRGSLFG